MDDKLAKSDSARMRTHRNPEPVKDMSVSSFICINDRQQSLTLQTSAVRQGSRLYPTFDTKAPESARKDKRNDLLAHAIYLADINSLCLKKLFECHSAGEDQPQAKKTMIMHLTDYVHALR